MNQAAESPADKGATQRPKEEIHLGFCWKVNLNIKNLKMMCYYLLKNQEHFYKVLSAGTKAFSARLRRSVAL